MIKRYSVLFATLCLVSCTTTEGLRTPKSDLRIDRGNTVTLRVDQDIAEMCKQVLGYDYPLPVINYAQIRPSAYIWELATKGKHGVIISQFEIIDGQIVNTRILSSKERHGRQIASQRYLQQFHGVGLSENGWLNKRVDGITGASTTSNAVEAGAVLALKLNAMTIQAP
jgi:hypothetical protein